MLTTDIPDMEILAVHLFAAVFARWHQCLWFKWWRAWGDRDVGEIKLV